MLYATLGTVRIYLGTLVHFLNFIIILEVCGFDNAKAEKLTKIVPVRKKNLQKDPSTRQYKKDDNMVQRYPTPEELTKMMTVNQ